MGMTAGLGGAEGLPCLAPQRLMPQPGAMRVSESPAAQTGTPWRRPHFMMDKVLA